MVEFASGGAGHRVGGLSFTASGVEGSAEPGIVPGLRSSGPDPTIDQRLRPADGFELVGEVTFQLTAVEPAVSARSARPDLAPAGDDSADVSAGGDADDPWWEPTITIESPEPRADIAGYVAIISDGDFYNFVRADDQGRLVVPVGVAQPSERGITQGVGRLMVRVVGVLIARKVVGRAADLAVRALEDKRPYGLRSFTVGNQHRAFDPNEPRPRLVGGRSLVLIHGFNGATNTGFGFDRAATAELVKRYGGRIVGFDHPTVSYSPLENAQRLAELLTEAKVDSIDIIAHSRGGLVARELKALNTGPAINAITFVAATNAGTPLADGRHLGDFLGMTINAMALLPDNPVTDPLAVALEVVRDWVLGAALPALAGIDAMNPDNNRLKYLNGLDHGDTELRAVAADFEPHSGQSTLLRLRNRVMDTVFDGTGNDLVVPTRSCYVTPGRFGIGPDHRLVLGPGSGVSHSTFWHNRQVVDQILSWHDPAATGARPSTVPAHLTDPTAEVEAAMEKGKPQDVRRALASLDTEALDAVGDQLGFSFGGGSSRGVLTGLGSVSAPTADADAVDDAADDAADDDREVVVVVPGIMGSRLRVAGRTVWFNPWDIMRGRFRLLDPDVSGTTGPNGTDGVEPAGVMSVYAGLVASLAVERRVLPFAYDWRLSVNDSADKLKTFLEGHNIATVGDRPVHFVGHSMGGLVARKYLAGLGADALDRWNGRFVQIGTPNWGSFSMVSAALGDEFLVKAVAAVDLFHSREEIVDIVRRFPGVFNLFPAPGDTPPDNQADRARLFDADFWDQHKAPAAIVSLLSEASDYYQQLGDLPAKDRVVYIAGDDRATPNRVRVANDGSVSFGVTNNGDGRVAHAYGHEYLGIDPDDIYYVPTDHGGLIGDSTVLSALDDILAGRRANLPTRPQAARSGTTEPPADDTRWVPSSDLDAALGLPTIPTGDRDGGGGLPPGVRVRTLNQALSKYVGGSARQPVGSLRVKVVHASLEQAHYPVVAGRYRGIPMYGALRFLDIRLNGALRHFHDVDLLPERIGEVRYLPRDRPGDQFAPPAAIVVGLGEFGELTATRLSRSVELGVLNYGLSERAGMPGPAPTFGVSAVLAGTPGRYGLSVSASVQAIVAGVARAADALRGQVNLNELEIVEFYESKAEEAALALRRLASSRSFDALSGKTLITADERIEVRPGGRPGSGYYEEESGQAWPRIMLDLQDPDPGRAEGDLVGDPDRRILRWRSLGRQAQAENLEVELFLDDIRTHVEAAVHNRDADEATRIALFEMLFPNQKKLEIDETDNLHLLVDEKTAWIPWEMLTGQGPSGEVSEPLALRSGMLRQLMPSKATETLPVQRPSGKLALVIGDPPSDLPRLPGARREAETVANLLQADAAGYEVTSSIHPESAESSAETAAEIRNQFFARDYRIIHIAAHGHYEPVKTGGVSRRDGVVIGPDQVLGALHFKQRRVAPDLVFLNCCHLGLIDGSVGESGRRVPLSNLAASVALQLMQSGVKAVVAAGWAVDDAAADRFATVFYQHMLDGSAFGEAVWEARRAAREASPSNTWGAYQCWGDPDFQFVDTKPRSSDDRPVVLSGSQLCRQLKIEVGSAGNVRSYGGPRAVADRLTKLESATVPFHDDATVAEAFGKAYSEVGNFDRAVHWYRRAIEAPKATVDIATLEQLVNLEARLAADRHRRRARAQAVGQEAVAAFEKTWVVPGQPDALFLKANAHLDAVQGIGESVERYAIGGSLAKKHATVVGRPSAGGAATRWNQLVNQSYESYRKSYELAIDPEGPKADWVYPGCMLVHMARIERAKRPLLKKDKEVLDRLTGERIGMSDVGTRSGDYWTLARATNILATEIIANNWLSRRVVLDDSGELKEATGRSEGTEAWQMIVEHYTRAASVRSTVRERRSPIEHYRDLADLLADEGDRAAATRVADELDQASP